MMSNTIDFDPRADYYKTLGIDAKASGTEVKKAYRKLAKQYHPDATGGDKAKQSRFVDVSKAYDVLGNKDKRAQYDAIRAGGGSGEFPGGFSGAGPGPGAGPGIDFGDLFSQMFGAGGARPPRTPGGGGVRYQVYTDATGTPLETFFSTEMPGGTREHRPPRREHRPPRETRVRASDGSLLKRKGDHTYSDVRLGFDEALLGTVKRVPTISGTASVKVPPGTSSGTKLRLRGKGPPTRSGGHGDHFVTVQIDVPKTKLDAKTQKQLVDLMKKLK